MKILKIAVIFLGVTFVAASAFGAGSNIVKMNSDVEITKDMSVNDVVIIDGNVALYGRVENNIVVIGGSIKLLPGSYVGREIVVVGGSVSKDPFAMVRGRITQIDVPAFVPLALSLKNFFKGGWLVLWATVSLMVLLGFLGLAVLIAALVPEHIGVIVNILKKSFVSMFLWGVLWAFIAVITLVFLAISIIGIVLIPLAVMIIALAWIVGYVASAIFIGKSVLSYFKKPSPPFVDALAGIILLFLTGFLPLIGPIVIKPIFLFAGFGAVLTTRFGTIRLRNQHSVD